MHCDTYQPRRACCAALALAAIAAAGHAGAQAYPVKPVRIVVPFAPGGANDILARLIGQKLTEAWSQQVIVENRAGGGTVIGTEHVARSAPDGYTLLMVSVSHASNPTLVKKLPFDTLRDLAPVILVGATANVLVAHPSLPARSVKELLAIARGRPGEIAYGSGGNGTSTHLSAEMLAQMGRIKLIHVPYKGAGPVTIDLLSGQITVMFGNLLPSIPHVKSGRMRALGVSSSRRVPSLPDVPAVAETLPGFDAPGWYGVSTTAGTPREVIARLNQEIAKGVNAGDIRDRLAREGVDVAGGTPEEFGAFFRNEIEKWAKVIRAAGIGLE